MDVKTTLAEKPTATPWTPWSADELDFNFQMAVRFLGRKDKDWDEMAEMLTQPVGDC